MVNNGSKPSNNLKDKKPVLINLPRDKGTLPSQLGHYLQLASNPYIQLVCQPLTSIQITYFKYVKRLYDGSYIHLTNNTSWLTHYFNQYYYLINEFDDPNKKFETGIYLWLGLNCQPIFDDMRNLFNISNGITLVQNYQNCCEFFCFGTSHPNLSIVNFYLNYIDTLKRFILYFKDKTYEIIDGLGQCRIVLPSRENNFSDNPEMFRNHIKQFDLLTEINRYYISDVSPDVYLTKREMECLKWYSAGKTAEEIGYLLGISKRTVESYLVEAKNKVNSFKKRQFLHNFNINIV